MDLSEISAFAEAQDAGSWHELFHPVDGTATGIRLKVVGPDSKRAHDASLSLQAGIARLQNGRGQVDPAKAEALYVEHLAKLVVDWEASQDGKPVPYSAAAVATLIRAGKWVQNQLAAFTAMRAPFVKSEVLH